MDTIAKRTIKRFNKSVIALNKAVHLGNLPERANQDSVLLRFELCSELAVKALKRILEERGSIFALPKDIVRSAVSANILNSKDAIVILKIIDDRNRMVHDYNEKFANDLYIKVKKKYSQVLTTLSENLFHDHINV